MFNINFANEWIRTADLWYQKQPLYQPSRNHCPLYVTVRRFRTCMHHSTCNGVGKILFAWAKDAPPTVLPDDVGFKIGATSREHLVLQVHYSHPLPEPDDTGLDLLITDNK